jgi:hypothetical protein
LSTLFAFCAGCALTVALLPPLRALRMVQRDNKP